MTYRLMADKDAVTGFPATPLIGTYSDLIPTRAAYNDLAARNPGAAIVLYDRGLGDPTGLASIADCEEGAMTVEQLRPWCERKRNALVPDVTVYHDREITPQVDAALAGLHIWRGIASFGDLAITHPGLAYIQFAPDTSLSTGYDLSVVVEDTWHRQGADLTAITDAQLHLGLASQQLGAAGLALRSIA
jgi:hypothetical protein